MSRAMLQGHVEKSGSLGIEINEGNQQCMQNTLCSININRMAVSWEVPQIMMGSGGQQMSYYTVYTQTTCQTEPDQIGENHRTRSSNVGLYKFLWCSFTEHGLI